MWRVLKVILFLLLLKCAGWLSSGPKKQSINTFVRCPQARGSLNRSLTTEMLLTCTFFLFLTSRLSIPARDYRAWRWEWGLEPPAGPPGSIRRWSRVILESITGAAGGSASMGEGARGHRGTARNDSLRSERVRTERRACRSTIKRKERDKVDFYFYFYLFIIFLNSCRLPLIK